MIQLRDKSLSDRDLLERAKVLVDICRRHSLYSREPAETALDTFGTAGTLAIVNDRADVAAAANADGVHLGQDDLAVRDARSIIGTQMLIGVSTHHIEQARCAVLDGANYLGAGPTFPSTTKAFFAFAGTDYLHDVAAEIRLPTFAIGGINEGNLDRVLQTGIGRIAVGAAVTQAEKPGCAARNLLDMLRKTGLDAATGNDTPKA